MHVLSTPPAFILSQDQTLRCSQTLLACFLLPIHPFRQLLRLSLASVRFASSHTIGLSPHAVGAPSADTEGFESAKITATNSSHSFEPQFSPSPSLLLKLLTPISDFPDLRSGLRLLHHGISGFAVVRTASSPPQWPPSLFSFDGTSHLRCLSRLTHSLRCFGTIMSSSPLGSQRSRSVSS